MFFFSFNADFFKHFSYQIIPETSRNLLDERLKYLHINFIQDDSDIYMYNAADATINKHQRSSKIS